MFQLPRDSTEAGILWIPRFQFQKLTGGSEHLANIRQGHNLPCDEDVGHVAERNRAEVAADERQSWQNSVLQRRERFSYERGRGWQDTRSTYRLNTESQHLLHVHRPGNDEDVVHPYPSESGESDRPGRPRRENGPPRNWHALRDSKENTIITRDSQCTILVTKIDSVKTISLGWKETSGAGECKR